MSFEEVIDAFAEEAPAGTLFCGLVKRIFSPERMDQLFREHKRRQVEGPLLFSNLIHLLTPVVTSKARTVSASHRTQKTKIGVSRQAVYDKLQGVECSVSEALVRVPTIELTEILQTSGVSYEDIIPGYHTFIIDGKRLDGTEHRIAETRYFSNAPLPGTVLGLLDTRTRLFADIACSPDGHACERKVVRPLLNRLQRGCLYISDRNFCDGPTLSDFYAADAYFIVRQHKRSPRWRLKEGSVRKRIGRDSRGSVVYEQAAEARVDDVWQPVRRITVELTTKTRDGDTEIHLFSNLPESVSASTIADGYRGRWTIETCLGHLAQSLNAEIKTLAYPKASLLCFALALTCYNIVTTLSQLISHHAPKKDDGPAKKPDTGPKKKSNTRPKKTLDDSRPLSTYYLSLEILDTWRGLEIATQRFNGWTTLAEGSLKAFCDWCKYIAQRADSSKYQKTTRGPKKPPPRRKKLNNTTHMSTQALINHRQPQQMLA